MTTVTKGLFGRLKDAIFPAPSAPTATPPAPAREENAEPRVIEIRRYDAATTSALNESQWRGAIHGRHINQDLADDLETLWARASYELQNNPMLEGVVNTFAIDVVGPIGPLLQIQSEDEGFNRGVEAEWQEFFYRPEETQQLHGAEVLSMWLRSLCGFGEYINQEVTIRRDYTECRLGIRQIDVRQLPIWGGFGGTPGGDQVAFSIEYNRRGVPLRYQIYPVDLFGQVGGMTPESVPADLINHVYRVMEPGQRRGAPWLASCLDVANDLRTFDRYTMTNAKHCAAQVTHFWTNHPDIDGMEWDQAKRHVAFEGSNNYVPPGWQATHLPPMHPSAQYIDFRNERMRDLGRPICMPVMVVLLSAAGNSFSGAHYDGAVYMRNIKVVQRMIEQRSLNHYLDKVAREWVSRDARSRTIPRVWNPKWTWPVAPYVNPKDMYGALRMRMEDGNISYAGLCAAFGEEEDQLIAERVASNKKLEAAGLPPLPVRPNFTGNISPGQPGNENSESDDSEETKQNGKVKTPA